MKSFTSTFEEQTAKYHINMVKRFNEMSLRYSAPDEDILNDPVENKTQFEYITKMGELVDEVNFGFDANFRIYEYEGNANKNIAFILFSVVAALIEYNVIDSTTIKIKFQNKHSSFRPLMGQIIIDYLLNQYPNIISDNIQTSSSFNFYERLARHTNKFKNNYEMYMLNDETGQETRITDIEQMRTSHGGSDGNRIISYKIKKI